MTTGRNPSNSPGPRSDPGSGPGEPAPRREDAPGAGARRAALRDAPVPPGGRAAARRGQHPAGGGRLPRHDVPPGLQRTLRRAAGPRGQRVLPRSLGGSIWNGYAPSTTLVRWPPTTPSMASGPCCSGKAARPDGGTRRSPPTPCTAWTGLGGSTCTTGSWLRAPPRRILGGSGREDDPRVPAQGRGHFH